MHEHSLAAWLEIQKNLTQRCFLVYRAIMYLQGDRGVCDQEITSYLNWGINCVSPRITNLKAQGMIREVGKKKIRKHDHALLVVTGKEDPHPLPKQKKAGIPKAKLLEMYRLAAISAWGSMDIREDKTLDAGWIKKEILRRMK